MRRDSVLRTRGRRARHRGAIGKAHMFGTTIVIGSGTLGVSLIEPDPGQSRNEPLVSAPTHNARPPAYAGIELVNAGDVALSKYEELIEIRGAEKRHQRMRSSHQEF